MANIKYLAFEGFLLRHLDEMGLNCSNFLEKMDRQQLNRLERLRYLAGHADPSDAATTLPLLTGKGVSLTHYGVLGHSFMQCRSLKELFQNIDRNLWILDPEGADGLQFMETDTHFQLSYPHPPIWPELPNFFMDLFFGALIQQSKELSGTSLTDFHLQLNRSEPQTPYHKANLGIEVTYGAAQDRLTLPRQQAERLFGKMSLIQSPLFREHCNALLQGMKREGRLVEKVRHQLLRHPPQQTKAEEIARNMGMSGRTLRRKLSQEKTSFRAVQQDVLLHLSQEYLLETPLSVADIAHFLGYHDTPTYNRAFKGLTGLTPAAYRRQNSS